MRRMQIVNAARRWIATPYRHQASCLGAGADCLGLLRGVWRDVIGAEPEALPAYTPDWSEINAQELLLAALRRHFAEVPIAQARAGDALSARLHRACLLGPQRR
jgi:NlpC/P60 family putative phage cell wall peptidase